MNTQIRTCRFFAGVKHGLQLLVNVEQYEYMTGPHNAVGLKVLLHRQGDVQQVQDFGDNVPAGMQTFVAVSVSKVSSIFDILFDNIFLEHIPKGCIHIGFLYRGEEWEATIYKRKNRRERKKDNGTGKHGQLTPATVIPRK